MFQSFCRDLLILIFLIAHNVYLYNIKHIAELALYGNNQSSCNITFLSEATHYNINLFWYISLYPGLAVINGTSEFVYLIHRCLIILCHVFLSIFFFFYTIFGSLLCDLEQPFYSKILDINPPCADRCKNSFIGYFHLQFYVSTLQL